MCENGARFLRVHYSLSPTTPLLIRCFTFSTLLETQKNNYNIIVLPLFSSITFLETYGNTEEVRKKYEVVNFDSVAVY